MPPCSAIYFPMMLICRVTSSANRIVSHPRHSSLVVSFKYVPSLCSITFCEPITVNSLERKIHAFEGGATEAERTAAVAAVMRHWREADAFEILRGWRDEPWPVYGAGGRGKPDLAT